MNNPKFTIGEEVFLHDPFGFTNVRNFRYAGDSWEYLVEGSDGWIEEDCIAYGHFDTIEDALQVGHIYHPGFVAGPGDPIILFNENLGIEASLGNCTEINIPHINIFRNQLDSINYANGICLSLISNEYIMHQKMHQILSRLEFVLIIDRLKSKNCLYHYTEGSSTWENLIKMWNEGDLFNPQPVQYDWHLGMPDYNYETITRRNLE